MTVEEFEKLPREKRWSYSRIMSFATCPRQHHYTYNEEIRSKGNIYTDLGDYWHRIMKAKNTGGDYEEVIKEYETAVKAGAIDKPEHLMRHVFNEYESWYAPDNVLHAEEDIIEEWEDGDYAIFKIDCIYEKDGLNILRDYKTTIKNLKYDFSSVKYNQQLLIYKPIAEAAYGIKIHGVEIDEIRLAICEDVPFNKNGKPTADIRRLGLVKYETYLNTLEEMGLEDEPEYQSVLTELEKRGHPLFRRITIDVSDDHIVDENLDDLYGLYKVAKSNIKSRKRSVLCDYCDYKELCEAEYTYLDDAGKQILIDRIVK